MADVAAAAGVSTSTVSKVVNDRYGVSVSTSDHVLSVIERLGYVPDLAATALRGGATRVIGLFVQEFGPWEAALLTGATAEALGEGYALCVLLRDRVVRRRTAAVVDGAIVVGSSSTEQLDGLVTAVVARTDEAHLVAEDIGKLGRRACRRVIRSLNDGATSPTKMPRADVVGRETADHHSAAIAPLDHRRGLRRS